MTNLKGLGVVLTLAVVVASWSPSEVANAQDFDAVVERAASRWADDSVLDASRTALRQFTLEWQQALWIVSACQKMDICMNPKNKWRFKIAKNFDVR